MYTRMRHSNPMNQCARLAALVANKHYSMLTVMLVLHNTVCQCACAHSRELTLSAEQQQQQQTQCMIDITLALVTAAELLQQCAGGQHQHHIHGKLPVHQYCYVVWSVASHKHDPVVQVQ